LTGKTLNLATGSGVTLVTQIFTFLLGIGTSILTARLLGPDGRGVYSLWILAFSLVLLVISVSIPQFTACFAGKQGYSAGSVFLNGIILSAIGGGLAWVVGGIVWLYPGILPQGWQIWYVILIAVFVPFGLLAAHTQAFLQGVDQILSLNILRILAPFVNLASLLIALVWLKSGVAGAALAWGSGQVAVALVGLIISRPFWKGDLRFQKGILGHSMRFGLSTLVSQLVGGFNQRFDFFLVGFFLTSAAVGQYSIAVSLAVMLWYIPASIGTVMIPKLAKASYTEGGRITAQVCRATFAINILTAIIAAAVVSPLIPIVYGNIYLPSISAFLFLLPGVAVFGLAHLFTAYIQSTLNRPLIATFVAGLSLTIDVLLDLVLIPKWGIIGASISSTISYTGSLIVAAFILARYSNIKVLDFFLPHKDDWVQYRNLLRSSYSKFRLNLAKVLGAG
jgi:O-antigen/teichoic acid export membrane protein